VDRRLIVVVVTLGFGILLWLVLAEPRRKPRPYTPSAEAPSVAAPRREPPREVPRSPVAALPPASARPLAGVTTTDRKRRDAARRDIREALAKVDAGPSPQLDPGYVQRALYDDLLPAASACHALAAARRPGVAGAIVLRLSFAGAEAIGGIVESADVLREASTLDDAEITRCVRDAALSMTFPPPPRAGTATLTYPITLPRDAGLE
jgi:hypothetical protein